MAYTNLSDLFKGICDAIRAKKGTTGTINHQDIPSEIASIQTGTDVSGVTASASDVKSGKYYVNSSGTLTQGTMSTVTQPTPSISVSSGGVITATSTLSNSGYMASGTKSNTKSLTTKQAQTYTPTTYNQTISSGQYLTGTQTIQGDSNLVASNIKSGVSIFGVTGNYQGTGDDTVGYIGEYSSTRTSRTSISFGDFSDDDIDNMIGFYIVASDTVDSSSSYDYITSLFTYGSTFIVQTALSDATVDHYTNSNGDRISWAFAGASVGGAVTSYSLSISIDHNYLGFRSSIIYKCFPIYKKGGLDISVDVEIT